ncbi:MAG: carbamoyltransferase HypF [Pirellulales bacterium]
MERRAVTVRGIVQGVGFRPYVYHLAQRLRLAGCVRNESGAVHVEIEGEPHALNRFCRELSHKPPPLAAIERISWRPLTCRGDAEFVIAESAAESADDVFISPDVATCPDCWRELFDPTDRRFRYPFLNCTNCGPRLTIIQGAPYDRALTTMAPFAMCAACRGEYHDPRNRRYHAQPTCCPRCGPRLSLLSDRGVPLATRDPLATFALALRAGQIGALKGLGGFHLACDAGNERAVAELRRRKRRDAKPLAVMVVDVEQARAWCNISAAERQLLESRARPIVLLRRKNPCLADSPSRLGIAQAVAPGNPYLGVMLPYTPLHYLLLDIAGRIPLVMTSGNRSDEPIAYDDQAALEQLAGIADLFLTHNRPIHVRCDDSVTRVVGHHEYPIRRSRGAAPRPVALPVECSTPTLAVGGQLKSTFALGRGGSAVMSHHLGDLDHLRAYRAFERDIALYEELFDVHPSLIVHDLHPDYASTSYALRRATLLGIDTLGVQHHHAHIAACMAEHGLRSPVLGVAFDGTGLGTDGAIWGGEFLIANLAGFRRAAHLRYVPLPGGDQAIRQPWRAAVAHALDAGCNPALVNSIVSHESLRVIRQMLDRGVNCPHTSSVGRLFDAVAALTRIQTEVSFEGQAAMQLEWLATAARPDGSYPFDLQCPPGGSSPPYEIDTRPLLRAVAEDVSRGATRQRIARRFQSTMVDIIAAVCARLRNDTQLADVVLSGGVFLNVLLTEEAVARLTADGFRVWRHEQVPPNDGGISLGQLAVAAAIAAERTGVDSTAAAQWRVRRHRRPHLQPPTVTPTVRM